MSTPARYRGCRTQAYAPCWRRRPAPAPARSSGNPTKIPGFSWRLQYASTVVATISIATPAATSQEFGGEYLHAGLPAMAAAYLFHIAQNRAFHDGNKRTAALSALIFLEVNGVELPPEPDALERTTLAVADSRWGKQELEQWMRRQLDPGGSDRP